MTLEEENQLLKNKVAELQALNVFLTATKDRWFEQLNTIRDELWDKNGLQPHIEEMKDAVKVVQLVKDLKDVRDENKKLTDDAAKLKP